MRTTRFALMALALAMVTTGAEAGRNGNRWDTTPDTFHFSDVSGAALDSTVLSDVITVSGINTATTITVSGGSYAVNGGNFTSTQSSVSNGDSVQLRQTSSAAYATTTDTTLTIGGVSDTFSVTTVSGNTPVSDTTPDPFSFPALTGVATSTVLASTATVISGIDAAAPLSVSGGEYAINGGTYTSGSGSINAGDSITLRLTSSASAGTTTSAVLTIGGVTGSFAVTTATATATTFELSPAASGDPWFTSAHFSGSSNCAMCHNGLTDANGQDVSIHTDWSSTMMANSSRDPLWRAKVRSELNRHPALASVINDKCSRCHAPMANEEARQAGNSLAIFDSGVLSAGQPYHDAALDGVSCTLCHQIKANADLGTDAGASGGFAIDSYAQAVDRKLYGPYDGVFANPMRNNVAFTPAYGAHIKDSAICATCHNLKTPYVDENGNVLSTSSADEFPEQMPYSEWLHSSYPGQKSCQSCHMSRADGVVMASRPPWLSTQRNDFAVHDFVGANKLMLDILDNNKVQLGVIANNFAETLTKTDDMLQGAASLAVADQQLADGVLGFTLQITSNAGHKLPTSFPSRRIIVHVKVTDAAGTTVFESGRVNSDGSVVGVDADGNSGTFEPHHDLITTQDQVQVYESIMGDNQGQVTYTLLRGAHYLKDNRLLPAGFDKSTAPTDIQVVGAARDDGDFVAGGDKVHYRIAAPGSGPYNITAELVYQTVAHAFANDLFSSSDAEVVDFRTMFEASNHKSTVMKTLQFSVD